MTPAAQILLDNVRSGTKYSIRTKLMLVVLATALAALLLSSAAMVIYELRTYREARVNDLRSQADLIGRSTATALAFDDATVAKENLSLLKVTPGVLAAAIYTAKGKLFATYARGDIAGVIFPSYPQSDGYQIDGNELVLVQQVADKTGVLGTVYLRARYELVDRLTNYLSLLAGVMVLSLVAAVLMTAWLQAVISKPILEVTRVAYEVMTRRDFTLRARKTTQDEIGYLVDAFNAMLAEIGRRAQSLEASNRALQEETGERRVAEEALLAADQRKDEFLATLAHELRNPLAPLRNALEILRNAGSDAGATRSARDMMERQLRQLVRLVDDLLDISRITTGKLALQKERVELQDIMTSALEAARPHIDARHHRLTLLLPPAPVQLLADFTRLAQVFLNLLNNAAKFTEVGGDITFEAEVKGDDLVVTVTDTGIGIDRKMLPVIFDMFAQVDRSLERSQAGLGVGLTLVKHLVELHGGTITARSNGLGHGSQFIVRLPAVTQIRRGFAARGEIDAGSPVMVRRRILLADDNEDFANSLAVLLRAMGHEVRVTHDGLAAAKAAVVFEPEFAFLDIGLPKLNGYELARRLRDQPGTQQTILIAVTGWGQEDDRQRGREAGFAYHLVKPVDPEAILQILNTAHPS